MKNKNLGKDRAALLKVAGEKEKKSKTEILLEAWQPKTELGRQVKAKEILNVDEILGHGKRVLEPEIFDSLIQNLETILITVGQSKGKFGGGKGSIWRQTQKKTKEGNKPKFSTLIAVGNRDGYVGIGFGKSKETVPAREKAIRQSKLNIQKIRRGCGDWACGCGEIHSIPAKIEGKCGSVRIILKPAPKGTGLIAQNEVKRVLELAGIKDIYTKTFGQTKTKINLIYALEDAFKKLNKMKLREK